MKILLLAIAFFVASFAQDAHWNTDFAAAQKNAITEHKMILLNFSGSDWCGPCIRLRKEVFDTPEFLEFAKNELVLVNADFPRQNKNKLSKEQQAQNDKLADQFNNTGAFPFTVLLDENGKVIKSWQGFQKQGVGAFINEIKEAMNGNTN